YRAEAKPAADVTARLEAIDRSQREAADDAAAKAAAVAEAQATNEQVEVTPDACQPEPQSASEGTGSESEAGEAETPTEASPGDKTTSPSPQAAGGAGRDTADQSLEEMEAAPEPAADADQPAAEAAAEVTERSDTDEGSDAAEAVSAAEKQSIARTEPTPTGSAASGAAEEEPKPILLWRPARFDRSPRQQHHRGHAKGRHQDAAYGEAARNDAGGQNRNRFDGKAKRNRVEGEGGQGRHRHRKGSHDGGRQDSSGKGKPSFQPRAREERPARFDPDSPFAKLAALRDQLKK
ncbi:MAG: helicase, partial [Rhizobiaceae bacterium]